MREIGILTIVVQFNLIKCFSARLLTNVIVDLACLHVVEGQAIVDRFATGFYGKMGSHIAQTEPVVFIFILNKFGRLLY